MNAIAFPEAAPRFDYSSVSADDRQALEQAAERIRTRAGHMQRAAIIIGREILAVKDRLPHGGLGPWIEAELGITPRTAQSYMNVVRRLDALPEAIRETVSLLPLTTLHKLAAPSTPPVVIEEIAQAAEQGALPEPAAILHRIDAALIEQRDLRRVMARKPGRTEAEAKKIIRRSHAEVARDRERRAREEIERRAAERAAEDAFSADMRAWAEAYPAAADAIAALAEQHARIVSYNLRIMLSAIRGDGRA